MENSVSKLCQGRDVENYPSPPVSTLPHKILYTQRRPYLYLPFNNRFYPLNHDCVDSLKTWLRGEIDRDSIVVDEQLAEFLNDHPEIPEALERYQGFEFHNPISTTGYREAIADHLTTCVLCVTEQCNLRCSYCCYSDHYPQSASFSSNYMKDDVARQAVKFFYSHSRKTESELTLGFYGGEPMINFPMIRRTTAYAKDLFGDQITFSMTTNATLLNQEKIDFLIDNNFGLTISLDGDQNSTDRYRKFWKKKDSVFDSVYESVKMIRDTNKDYFLNRVIFNSVLSGPVDFEALEKTFVEDIGTRATNVGLAGISSDHTDFFEHYPEASQYDDVLEQAEDQYYQSLIDGVKDHKKQSVSFYHFLRGSTIRIKKRLLKPIDQVAPFPTGQCVPMVFQTYVRPGGDIYVCEKFDGNGVGNVFEGIDTDTVEKLFQPYYEDAAETCSQCWVQRLCSNCIVGCMNNGTFDAGMKRSACKGERASYEDSMTRYLETLEQNPEAFDLLDSWSYE